MTYSVVGNEYGHLVVFTLLSNRNLLFLNVNVDKNKCSSTGELTPISFHNSLCDLIHMKAIT